MWLLAYNKISEYLTAFTLVYLQNTNMIYQIGHIIIIITGNMINSINFIYPLNNYPFQFDKKKQLTN